MTPRHEPMAPGWVAPVRAVLFDLDNTLTDRSASVRAYAARFASDFAGRLAPIPPADLCDAIRHADGEGYNPKRALQLTRVLPWIERPRPAVVDAHWLETFPTVTAARDDAMSTLATLRGRGLRLGLVTNGSSETQRAKIAVLDLQSRVDAIVISDEVGVSKPDPAIFRAALEELDVGASEAMFVGDHPDNDIIGAARVGMHAVWLSCSGAWPTGREPPPGAVAQLQDVLSLV